MSTNIALPIVTDIRGRKIARDEVLRYEDHRINAAAKKLGIAAPTRGDVEERREAFLQSKLALGTDEILRRLKRDRTLAGAIAKATARVSARRRLSLVTSSTGNAARSSPTWNG